MNELKKRKGDLIGELYHSLSYTLIEIMLKEPGWQVGMSLAYHNSDSELPTQSNITVWPLVAHLVSQTAKNSGRGVQKNAAAFRLPINEALFRAMPLPQVCDELIIDLRDTLGLSPLEQAIEAPSASTQSPMEIEIEAPMEFSQEAPH